MNEKIKELALRSGALYSKTSDNQVEYLDHRNCIFDERKFAELIIQECIDKITTYDLVPGHSAKWEDIYDIHTRLLQDLGEELKEHFGVE